MQNWNSAKTLSDNRVKKLFFLVAIQHRFFDLDQITVNGMRYNDGIVGKNMHTIRSEIKKEYNPYIEKIPKRIREKYEHVKF